MRHMCALLVATAITASACQKTQTPTGGTEGAAPVTQAALVERGKYVAKIMDCAGCHNRGSFSPKPEEGHLEGGTIGFEVPGLGVFYPPNLTPDAETGLGRWTEADIIKAVRTGQRPDGRELAPAMPWHAYSALNDEDAKALAVYLKSMPPVKNAAPAPGPKGKAPRPYMTVVAPGVH